MTGKLSEHIDEIEDLYFVQQLSYQEIADKYGKTREAIRQFLNLHFPKRESGWEFRKTARAQERAVEVAAEDAFILENAPSCVICFKPVLRKTGGSGKNRTCCHEHAVLWSQARFLLDDNQREKQRKSTAKSVLRYSEDHDESERKWARQVLRGAPRQRTYARKDSKAFHAYLEVMRIRGEP